MRRSFVALVTFAVLLLVLAMLTTQPTFVTPGGAAKVEPAKLEAHVRMLSQTCRPRDSTHPENLDRAAAYIAAQLTAAGATEVHEEPYDQGIYRNVVGRVGTTTGQRIVVGAHYDAFGDLPGADDNASGVAALIELARLLAREPAPFAVELVAYSLEEPPFFRTAMMGSAVHAESLGPDSVKAMIALETLGFFNDDEGSQMFPVSAMGLIYPTRGNFIALVARPQDIPLTRTFKAAMQKGTSIDVRSINAPPIVAGIDFSDHASYWARGIPALMVTDTAFMRNTAYHTEDDIADRLDYDRMADVVTGVHAAVLSL